MVTVSKIKSITRVANQPYVYDLCCTDPHSYVSNGFISHNCVILLDEIEKVFGSQHDAGVTSSLLGSLLWWLQEHKTQVFTIMTTNSKESIPKELYREGRIDAVMVFQGLESLPEATEFAAQVFGNLAKQVWPDDMPDTKKAMKALKDRLQVLFSGGKAVPQVAIVQEVQAMVKRLITGM